MLKDEIVEEIHRIREEHAKSFNYDFEAIFADLQKQQAASGRKLVSLQPKQQSENKNSKIMTTLDQVLETALQLPDEQQEMLIKILQNRRYESRRAEIAADAKQTLADFQAGKFLQQSAEDVILALRESLDEPEA